MKNKKSGEGFALPNNYRSAAISVLLFFCSFAVKSQIVTPTYNNGVAWVNGPAGSTVLQILPNGCGAPSNPLPWQTSFRGTLPDTGSIYRPAFVYYDTCNHKGYFFDQNSDSWNEIAGGGCIDGVKPNTGVITQLTDSTFSISDVTFYLECQTYNISDTTIKIPQPGDTGRVDIIIATVNGVITQITGTEGLANDVSYTSDTAFAIGYILVSDTGVVVGTPPASPQFALFGSMLQQIVGDSIKLTGKVLTSGAGSQFIARNSSTTADLFRGENTGPGGGAYSWRQTNTGDWQLYYNTTGNTRLQINSAGKLLVSGVTTQNSTANVMVVKDTLTGIFGTRPIPTGASTPTWQQTLTAGSTLSASNTVNVGGNYFIMQNASDYQFLSTTGSNSANLILAPETDASTPTGIYRSVSGIGGANVLLHDTSINLAYNTLTKVGSLDIKSDSFRFLSQNDDLSIDTAKVFIVNSPIAPSADSIYGKVNGAVTLIPNTSSGIPTLQQVLTSGSTLNTDNDIEPDADGTRSLLFGDSQNFENIIFGASDFFGATSADQISFSAASGRFKVLGIDSINTPQNIIWQDNSGFLHKAAVPSGGGADTTAVFDSTDFNTTVSNDTVYVSLKNHTGLIDLNGSNYTITEPGTYEITDNNGSSEITFPDPTDFDGTTITLINTHADPAVFSTSLLANNPYATGSGTQYTEISGEFMCIYKSINGKWRGGQIAP